MSLDREEQVILRDRRAGGGSLVVEMGVSGGALPGPTAWAGGALPLQAAPLAAKPYI